MLKVKNGDVDKLSLLFERYHRRLYHFFYRLNRRSDVSEDLVQNVFERILKYRSTYNDGRSFSTWIFQIARNLHIDHYRKLQNEIDVASDFDNLDEIPYVDETNESNQEELQLLQQAMDQLGANKKQALVLSRFQGFKYKEIAEILDCTESAVKVRIFRAIRELEVLMKELKQA